MSSTLSIQKQREIHATTHTLWDVKHSNTTRADHHDRLQLFHLHQIANSAMYCLQITS